MYQLIGAIGLVIITAGVLIEDNRKQSRYFVVGGLCLLVYSIHLKDPIFIPLQIIFTAASLYEIYKPKQHNH